MTDLLLPRTWASPCSSLPPWQTLRLRDGSIARWLSLANGSSRRMYDIRPRTCGHDWNSGSTSGVGNVGSNSEFLGHVRKKHDLKCWYGKYDRGLSHVRWNRNQGLRVRCCCSSSHSWQKARAGDGIGIGKRERNSCARRQECLCVGLGHRVCRNQGLKVICCCASSHSRQKAREGNHDLHVEGFSGRGLGFRVLRRGVKAHAVDGPLSWFHNFLFQSIDEADYDTGEEDVGEEELDIPEFGADGVDFEPRADEDAEPVTDEVDALLEDDRRFFRWRMKNQARNEVREFQSTGRDPDGKEWEDWLDDSWNQYEDNLASGGDDGWYEAEPNWDKGGVPREPPSKPERGMKRTIKELFFRIFEPEDEVVEDLQFEERVFRFTSRTTAKFVGVLIVVPVVTDILLHDFVLVPFLQTYVEKVPLAAKVLDIRESQKLIIIEKLKLERQRVRFEAEIGKAPPLSDDELSEHIREEALELREEFRLENREAFASIWSDFAAGLTILFLLVFNPQQVAIMRLTGERLFTNISDTGKAFIIILLTDIFLGYHSETGWETVSEMVLEHYGIEVSQAAIYLFVAIVPVTIDACFKLWVFRFFRTLSPSASATFREMQRH